MTDKKSKIFAAAHKNSSAAAPKAAENNEHRNRGRPKLEHPKEAITLRLDYELIAYFKNHKGRHWRAEMRKALVRAMQEEKD